MEQQLQIFEHEQFGKIRVIMISGEIWFVAIDVCRALEIGNPSQALKHLDEDEKSSITLPKNGVTNTIILNEGNNDATCGWIENRVNIVNEPGFYRLVFASRKKEARDFQRWVYHEVLPSIRKTGSYSLSTAKTSPAHVPNPNRRAGQLKDSAVYVARVDNNAVKIGQSYDVEKRKSSLKSQCKLTLGETYQTSLMPRKVSRAIEKACHTIFSSSKIGSEIFSVDFEMACNVVRAFEKFVITFPQISDFERGEKLLKIADMIDSSPEKQALLIGAAELFVGKNLV